MSEENGRRATPRKPKLVKALQVKNIPCHLYASYKAALALAQVDIQDDIKEHMRHVVRSADKARK